MKTERWFMTLPPDGAARAVSMHAAEAFQEILPRFSFQTFDMLVYREAFKRLLNRNDPTIITDLVNQSFVIACLDFETTHLLTCALSPVTLFSLNLLKKQDVTTIHWFFEDYSRATYWKDVLPGYNHFFAIQKGPLPEICRSLGVSFHYLPTATSGNTGISSERIHDIAFIGIPSKYRIAVLEKIASEGYNLAIAGSGWKAYSGNLKSSILNDQWIDDKTSFEILNKSKIGINLSVDDPSSKTDVHISPRVFDISAAGCVLLSEDVPLFHETLHGCNYHTFSDLNDCIIKIKRIFNNYDSDKITAELNRDHILSNHTYIYRIRELMESVSQ